MSSRHATGCHWRLLLVLAQHDVIDSLHSFVELSSNTFAWFGIRQQPAQKDTDTDTVMMSPVTDKSELSVKLPFVPLCRRVIILILPKRTGDSLRSLSAAETGRLSNTGCFDLGQLGSKLWE